MKRGGTGTNRLALPRVAGLDPTEQLYRTMADHTSDVVIVTDPAGMVLWASPSTERILGLTVADLVGSVPLLLHPDDRDAARRMIGEAIRNHSDRWRRRVRVEHADGSWLWMDAAIELVWSDGGDRLAYAITSLRDVTELVEHLHAEREAKEALAAGEQLLRGAMQNAAIGMILVTPDGQIVEVNDSVCRFFGLTADDLRTRSWQELTHPEDLAKDLAHRNAMLAGTQDAYRTTKRYLHADGSVRIGDVSVTPIRGGTGQVIRFITQIVDVTEQHRMTEELARSEENFRLLADNMCDVVTREADGVLQWVSQSVTRLTGWRPDDLIGRRFADLVHPRDRAVVAHVQQGLRQGQSDRIEVRIRDAEGDYSWFGVGINPLRGQAGVSLGEVATWRDITGEVEARHLLAQREAEFREIAENAADVVVRITPDGTISWISPSVQHVLGWRADEIVGRHATDLADPDDIPSLAAALRGMRSGEPVRVSARLRCADDQERWFEHILTQVFDEKGEPVGAVVGLRDVDGEVRAIQALARSEEQFRLAMASAPGGMAVLDLDRRFVQVNDALVDLVGRDRQWLLEHSVADVVAADDSRSDEEMQAQMLSGRTPVSVQEKRLVRADGSVVWVQHSLGMLRDECGEPVSYVCQFVDITDAHATRVALRHAATHDALTRVCNRRGLKQALQRQLSHGPRTGTEVGVLALDVDCLKPINDSYGHPAGDEVLITVAERIRTLVRDDDTVARVGGDEFIVTLSAIHDLEDAERIAEKIRQSVCEPITVHAEDGRHEVHVTTSVGAVLAQPGERAKNILARADRAMYRAKSAGRDRVHAEA